MFKRALACALAICLLLGAGPTWARPFSRGWSLKRQVEIARILLPADPGDSGTTWEDCGTWNGFYFIHTRNIVLCNENLALGLGPARFIYLHELGHAYTIINEASFSRWDGNYEAAADEFAALMSILQGNPQDLVDMANVFATKLKPSAGMHPSREARAKRLMSLYIGRLFPLSEEGQDYLDTLRFWRNVFLEHPKWTPLPLSS